MTVTLRRAGADDLGLITGLEGRPDYRGLLCGYSEDRHRRHLDDLDHDYRVIAADGIPVGFAILRGLAGAARSIELKRIAVAEPGRGTGAAAIAALVRLTFSEFGKNRLWLDVFEDNERARRAYRRAGFVEEGTLREAALRRDGTLGSLVVMGMLAREWRAAQPATEVPR